MDKKIVGANAGKVWHALNEADGISIPELARKVNLARENKVVIERKNGLIEIYNEGHFDFSFG